MCAPLATPNDTRMPPRPVRVPMMHTLAETWRCRLAHRTGIRCSRPGRMSGSPHHHVLGLITVACLRWARWPLDRVPLWGTSSKTPLNLQETAPRSSGPFGAAYVCMRVCAQREAKNTDGQGRAKKFASACTRGRRMIYPVPTVDFIGFFFGLCRGFVASCAKLRAWAPELT